MVTTTSEITTDIPYVDKLQRMLRKSEKTADWLVVAHNDSRMNRRLAESLKTESAAILQVNQSNWNLGGNDLSAALSWAITDGGVRNLLFVGYSQVEFPKQEIIWSGGRKASNQEEAPQSFYSKLVEGTERVRQGIEKSKVHFIDQMTTFRQLEVVSESLAEDKLQLHALFYLAHGSVFQTYDFTT